MLVTGRAAGQRLGADVSAQRDRIRARLAFVFWYSSLPARTCDERGRQQVAGGAGGLVARAPAHVRAARQHAPARAAARPRRLHAAWDLTSLRQRAMAHLCNRLGAVFTGTLVAFLHAFVYAAL